MWPLTIIKVCGHSMAPFFNDQDYVVVIKRPFFRITAEDVVLFHKKPYGLMMKRVKTVYPKAVWVYGHHLDSVDSRHFGQVTMQAIFGKVWFSVCRM